MLQISVGSGLREVVAGNRKAEFVTEVERERERVTRRYGLHVPDVELWIDSALQEGQYAIDLKQRGSTLPLSAGFVRPGQRMARAELEEANGIDPVDFVPVRWGDVGSDDCVSVVSRAVAATLRASLPFFVTEPAVRLFLLDMKSEDERAAITRAIAKGRVSLSDLLEPLQCLVAERLQLTPDLVREVAEAVAERDGSRPHQIADSVRAASPERVRQAVEREFDGASPLVVRVELGPETVALAKSGGEDAMKKVSGALCKAVGEAHGYGMDVIVVAEHAIRRNVLASMPESLRFAPVVTPDEAPERATEMSGAAIAVV